MRWGLIPAWARSVKDADRYSMINARSEEIAQKRSFCVPFRRRRCLVPVSGFFEWKKIKGKKTPFAIHLRDEPIMSLAGIWECWHNNETAEQIQSFAIVTTASNEAMASIHHRMPVIVSPEKEEQWLDPENSDLTTLAQIMKPCPSKWLNIYQVRTLVNSPKNNMPEILEPVDSITPI